MVSRPEDLDPMAVLFAQAGIEGPAYLSGVGRWGWRCNSCDTNHMTYEDEATAMTDAVKHAQAGCYAR